MDNLRKALEQDAQVREERMPKKVTQQQAEKIAQRLAGYMASVGLSQKQVGRKIGASATAISQFVNKKYPGDLTDLYSKVVNFLDTQKRRDRKDKRGFVTTTVARAIFTVIKHAEALSDAKEGKIGVVVGDAGHGKSECLEEYARVNPNSVLVTLDSTMHSKGIFAEICKRLNLDHVGSLAMLTARLIEHLADREMTVLIDEASWLRVKQLDQLRQIIGIRCRCPMILSGNSQLLKTINDNSQRRGYESLDQFYSRLVCVANLDEQASVGKGDNGGGLYAAADIRALYERGGIRLLPAAVKMMQRICRVPGSGRLRTCSMIIDALLTSPEITTAGKIDGVVIVAAIRQLMLPVANKLPFLLDDPNGPDDGQGELADVKTA